MSRCITKIAKMKNRWRIATLLLNLSLILPLQLSSADIVPGRKTSDTLRSNGFLAEDHFVTTEDGYILNLVRARNPLINNGTGDLPNRDPVLFLHGTLTNANFFLDSAPNARPSDYTGYNASSMGADELAALLQADPSANSLVYTALNFGHEVWLLNRRGSPQSQGHVSESSVRPGNGVLDEKVTDIVFSRAKVYALLAKWGNLYNPRYWNFSLDQQVQFDLPTCIEHILEETGRAQLALVGHSAGSGIILMALSEQPDLIEKVSKALLWAPALNLVDSYKGSILRPFLATLQGIYDVYVGPLLPNELALRMQRLLFAACSSVGARALFCDPTFEFSYGSGGGHQNYAKFAATATSPVSSLELAHLFQSFSGKMHKFDFRSPIRNMLAYGQPDPPRYNISQVALKSMSIWYGAEDLAVQPGDVQSVIDDLTVPVELHYYSPDLHFNHIAYTTHRNVSRLLVQPSLSTIQAATGIMSPLDRL